MLPNHLLCKKQFFSLHLRHILPLLHSSLSFFIVITLHTILHSSNLRFRFVRERRSYLKTMCDEEMCHTQNEVDHPELIYKNANGSPALEHSANAISPDSSFTNVMDFGANMHRASDLLFGVSIYAEPTKTKIFDFAHSAMDELSEIGVAGKPLWQPHKDNRYETLNDIEYLKQFGQVDATLREIMKLVEVGEPQNLPGFDSYQTQCPTSEATPREALQIEASRDMAYINMSPINLVELLMDVNQWSRVFYNIVSKTTILGAFSDGVEGGYDGKLHVMSAELHLPTPVVPTRKCYFARYCKQLSHEKWGVVDVSLEKFYPSPSNNFRRRPSGCLIIGMPNGCSKVIWVEHVEVDHSLLNNHLKPLVTFGLAFGATRWLACMVRHSVWSETLKATKLVADDGVLIPQTGRTSFLKLADRMMRNFCANVSATTDNPWVQMASFPDTTDVKVMIKNNMEGTAKIRGTVVAFSTSLWLKVSPNRLFNFLRHGSSRNKWDILSQTLSIREFAYMTKGDNLVNRVSLMQAITSKGEIEIFYLQESYTDSIGSYVIYAPLDELALSALANGCNPDNVIILPSGFTILPADEEGRDKGTDIASFLTIAFYIVDCATNWPLIPHESVQTIHNIIAETVTSIKDAVLCHDMLNDWIED